MTKTLTQADFYPQDLPYGNVSEFCDHVLCNMCGSHGYVEQGVDNCPKCGEYGYLMDVEDASQAIDRE